MQGALIGERIARYRQRNYFRPEHGFHDRGFDRQHHFDWEHDDGPDD